MGILSALGFTSDDTEQSEDQPSLYSRYHNAAWTIDKLCDDMHDPSLKGYVLQAKMTLMRAGNIYDISAEEYQTVLTEAMEALAGMARFCVHSHNRLVTEIQQYIINEEPLDQFTTAIFNQEAHTALTKLDEARKKLQDCSDKLFEASATFKYDVEKSHALRDEALQELNASRALQVVGMVLCLLCAITLLAAIGFASQGAAIPAFLAIFAGTSSASAYATAALTTLATFCALVLGFAMEEEALKARDAAMEPVKRAEENARGISKSPDTLRAYSEDLTRTYDAIPFVTDNKTFIANTAAAARPVY